MASVNNKLMNSTSSACHTISMDIDITNNPQNSGDVEYIKIGNTKYEVHSFFNTENTLSDIITSGLKRDSQAVLRQSKNK